MAARGRETGRCPLCGARGTVAPWGAYGWVAHCADCYEPDPEAPAWRRLQGVGDDLDAAVCAWLEAAREYAAVDELPALIVSYRPNRVFEALAWQLAQERERQRGWFRRCAGTGNAPETCPIGGELLYGPAYSPTWPDIEWT